MKEAGVTAAGFLKNNKVYTGSDANYTSYPIGTCLYVNYYSGTTVSRNKANAIKYDSADSAAFVQNGGSGTLLSGTWNLRGKLGNYVLYQRTA